MRESAFFRRRFSSHFCAFLAASLSFCTRFKSPSSRLKKRGLETFSPSLVVRNDSSPTSTPTTCGEGSRRFGSISTEKVTYHLFVRERFKLTVLISPSRGRCQTSLTRPIFETIRSLPRIATPFPYCG